MRNSPNVAIQNQFKNLHGRAIIIISWDDTCIQAEEMILLSKVDSERFSYSEGSRMKIESFLTLKKKIAALEMRLEDLRNLSLAATSAFDGLPHAKARTSPIERILIRIDDAEKELATLKAELAEASPRLVEEIISRIEPPMATALILHDVQGLSFRETARRMHYSLRNVFALHKQARADFLKGGVSC